MIEGTKVTKCLCVFKVVLELFWGFHKPGQKWGKAAFHRVGLLVKDLISGVVWVSSAWGPMLPFTRPRLQLITERWLGKGSTGSQLRRLETPAAKLEVPLEDRVPLEGRPGQRPPPQAGASGIPCPHFPPFPSSTAMLLDLIWNNELLTVTDHSQSLKPTEMVGCKQLKL